MNEAVEELRTYLYWWDWGYYDCMRRKDPDYAWGSGEAYDAGYDRGIKRLKEKYERYHEKYLTAVKSQEDGDQKYAMAVTAFWND